MLTRLRIGPKLLLAPGAVLLLLLVLSSAAWYAMVRQNASLESIVGQRAASMRATASLATESQQAHADIYRLLSWMGGSFPVARTEPLRQDILARHRRIAAGLDALERSAAGGATRQVTQAVQAQRRYAREVREVIELAQLDGSIGANAMQKAEGAFAMLAQQLAGLAAREEALSRQAAAGARADFRVVSLLLPGGVALAIALSLAITLAVRRILLREIRGIGQAASGLASGDLTLPGRGHDYDYGGDEIADTARQLDASIRNLGGTLRSIADSAQQIGAASRDIKLGSLSLGSRAVFRAGALAHAGQSLQALAASASLNADAALAANRLAAGAAGAAGEGSSLVERLAATLAASRRDADRVAGIVDGLEAAAGEAGTLALNAALDAARGRGEARMDNRTDKDAASAAATVAAEVRALARRIAAAGREIRAAAAQSAAAIEGGAGVAAHAGASLDHIAGSVRQMESLALEIGARSGGQASRLDEVEVAIVRMDGVTRHNCTLVEDAARAARTLQLQALALSRTVAGFRLEEEGGAPAKVAPPVRSMRAMRAMHDGVPFAPMPERGWPKRERRRHPASHLWLASSRK